ncbi:MAG: AraC family transcriptional regulator [Bacteroidaceae bacterium]|nr:AraC family transcriptional regulator [Bacteroidaceae bacterium]
MRRYSIKEIANYPIGGQSVSYKDQIAVLDAHFADRDKPNELFSIDAFAIGYTIQGFARYEFNNIEYRLERGDLFILAPTHTCRIIECGQDYKLRMLLIDPVGYNLSVHLNYLVKSERWTQTYFNPTMKLDEEEIQLMKECTDRIIDQIKRKDCPNQIALIRLATTWHHVELDNIMQKRQNDTTDNSKPLTRIQTLARQLYRLIVNNYRKEHQVSFYSEQMCLTPQYLNQITNKVFGETLSDIISNLLFSTARAMILSSEMSLQEIADELYFPDQASFSKFIKKKAGVSPNALRKKNPHL